jgi:hypothetical protein
MTFTFHERYVWGTKLKVRREPEVQDKEPQGAKKKIGKTTTPTPSH